MPDRSIAYVLKGYPRISELFIASEIWRLEQTGLHIRLHVLKRPDEEQHHPVVDRIAAQPMYLPATTPLSNEPLHRWLRHNLAGFVPSLGRVARRHPVRLTRAVCTAGAQSIRAHKGWRPRKIYAKELLQAVALADEVIAAGDVGQLHAHFAHGTTTVTWLASIVAGLPFSFTAHAKDIYQQSLNPAGLLARKMRQAQFVVTCTGANHAHLDGVESDASVHLVYHGLNADFAQLVAAGATYEPPRIPRLVSVGRLVPKKGFDILVDAVALLHARGLQLELIIAGEDGPVAADLHQRVHAAGLDAQIRFVGIQTQAELLELYRSATAFALACRIVDDGDRDGIPNVLVEAMATGLPVVSTSVSGIPELIDDGYNGLLVQPESPEALAEAVWRVIKDPALAADLSAAGRQTVADRFDGELLAARMAELFAPAVIGANRAGR